MSKYVITKGSGRILSFLLGENGHAIEIHADRTEEEGLLGNIYIGRVQKVVKNLQAAFVEIAPGKACYLPLEDIRSPIYTKKGPSEHLQQGDELVVQIFREAMKTKGPAVTTRLCLQGKYVILDMHQSGIGVSKKLEESRRTELKNFLIRHLKKMPEGKTIDAGIVLRTNAAETSEQEIIRELEELCGQLQDIQKKAVYRTCYSCLYQVPSQWLRRLNGLRMADTLAIVVEEEALFIQAKQYLQEYLPEMAPLLLRYQDSLLPMRKLYSLERELREALSEKVWLGTGGYLVIQPTEALTAVDVNTGRCEIGKKKEETILKVNLEAARETARQLRLRNLSGIIIIDFINMEIEEARKQVMGELKNQLTRDPIQANVIDMTRLNLVEVTRKKVEGSLSEHISFLEMDQNWE